MSPPGCRAVVSTTAGLAYGGWCNRNAAAVLASALMPAASIILNGERR